MRRMTCWRCGHAVELADALGIRDRCPGCDSPLHACRNCEFYDPAFNNACRETAADRVVEKEEQNFCDYFRPSAKPLGPARSGASDLRAALEGLFKKPG